MTIFGQKGIKNGYFFSYCYRMERKFVMEKWTGIATNPEERKRKLKAAQYILMILTLRCLFTVQIFPECIHILRTFMLLKLGKLPLRFCDLSSLCSEDVFTMYKLKNLKNVKRHENDVLQTVFKKKLH